MIENDSLTWEEGLQKFIKFASTKGSVYELRLGTIKTYKSHLLLFRKVISLKLLKEITLDDVVFYIQQMRRDGRQESYINIAVSALRAAFRFWKELGYSENPIENYHFRISAKRGIRGGRGRNIHLRKTKALSVEQIKALFQVIESEIAKLSNSNDKKPLAKLFRAWLMIAIFYSTGLRKGELLQITPNKVSYAQRTFYVIRKGHTEPIHVMITELLKFICPNEEYPDVLEKVKDYIAYRNLKKDDRLFDTSERTVGRHIDYWAKKAKIIEKVYPHRFRHTFGTHMGAMNISEIIIQNLMDHKDPDTSRIYIQTKPEQDAKVLNNLGLFKGIIEDEESKQTENNEEKKE